MVILARILTVLLGALPASVLSVWALLGILAGATGILEGHLSGALLVVWGLSGIYGTVSLGAVGIGCDEPTCILGLAVGIAAILPLAIRVDPHSFLEDGKVDLSAVALLAPLFIGAAWLLAFLIRRVYHRPLVSERTAAEKHQKG